MSSFPQAKFLHSKAARASDQKDQMLTLFRWPGSYLQDSATRICFNIAPGYPVLMTSGQGPRGFALVK